MKTVQTKWNELVYLIMFTLTIFTNVLYAESLTLLNGNFESGSTDSLADNWTERSGESDSSVYFKPGQGYYNESGSILNRAASIMSTGTAYLQQTLNGVQANQYDTYKIFFDIGYRNDAFNNGNITKIRVSIWNITNNVELAGEDIVVGFPGVDSSQSPNVGMITPARRVVLNVNRSVLSTQQVALRFANSYVSSPAYTATAVIDNVSIDGFARTAQWNFEDNLSDSVSTHNGTAYNTPAYTGKGILGTKAINLIKSESDAVVIPYSSQLCPETFTVTAWAKVTSGTSGAYRSVVSNRGLSRGWTLYATNENKWGFWTSSGSAWIPLVGPSINEDQWCFLAVSFEKTGTSGDSLVGNKRLYVDGELVASAAGVLYKNDTGGTSMLIGAGKNETAGYDYFFGGLIDDVHFYNYYLSASEIASMYSSTSAPVFRVLSYNIHHGAGTDSVLDLSRTADAIDRTGADIICLQEVDNGRTRSNNVNQAQWLADELVMYYAFGPALDSTYGNAILSKYPILAAYNFTLPVYSNEEQRACLIANIEVKGKTYTIMATHLDNTYDEGFIKEVNSILNTASGYNDPKILCGDFNVNQYSTLFKHILHTFDDGFEKSISEVSTSSRIDHITVSHDFTNQVNKAETVDNSLTQVASDHKPVLVEIMP